LEEVEWGEETRVDRSNGLDMRATRDDPASAAYRIR
jgi:hypothetical protein